MSRLSSVVVLGVVVTMLSSCRSRPAGEHDHEGAEPHPAEGALSERAEEIPLAGLRGIRMLTAPEPRAEGAWFPGEAIGDEHAQFTLSSPVAGIVATAPAAPGRPVGKGVELLAVNSPELAELYARALVAQAELERATAALEREQRLVASGGTSQREVEEARRELAAATAGRDAARSGLAARGLAPGDSGGRYVLRAPAGGAVVRWDVRNGQGIEAGQSLGLFQTASARLVRMDLTPPGPPWRIGDDTDVRASDGRRWKARVVGVPAVLAEDTRRLTFRLELTEGERPLPGLPVEVRVPFAAAVILPQAALQQIEGTWGVFVRSGDHAAFHPVRRGLELGADVAILEGVRPGDEVVTDGAYLLKSLRLKSSSGGDEHEH